MVTLSMASPQVSHGFICIVSQRYCLRWTLGRVAAGRIEGDVRINGHPKEQSSFARVSGYVEQFDTHTAAATVKEALIFSGTLRNGKEVDMKTTTHFVDQVYPYCHAQSLVNTDCATVCSVWPSPTQLTCCVPTCPGLSEWI